MYIVQHYFACAAVVKLSTFLDHVCFSSTASFPPNYTLSRFAADKRLFYPRLIPAIYDPIHY